MNLTQPPQLDQTPLEILQGIYGYPAFRAQQQDIIDSVIAGEDCLVLMPTGGGKSLCYQIPALLRPGTGIVISPLIALMQDQVNALEQLGIHAAFLNSTQSSQQQAQVTDALRQGQLQLLYIAPERINQPATRELLKQCDIALIAIDEAHCVSQWGHDFRSDYLLLDDLAMDFAGVPRIALTATATPQSRQDIVANLNLNQPKQFIDSFDRPNICYRVSSKQDARRQFLRFIANHPDESGIVYCLSRKRTESTALWLQQQGYNALHYHAGMDPQQRLLHQQRFLNEESIIMVATIAFGMGIDKPDVSFVAHLNLPRSVEAYYQETGRAGRDGRPAEALLLFGLDDVVQLRQFIDQSEGSEQHQRNERNKLDQLLGWCESTDCLRQALLAYFGENSPEPCGNCSNCLSPPDTQDATEAAQMLLSTVYRTGQRFGLMHVIDILLGKSTDKTRRFNHEQLSTFGIGAQHSVAHWRSVARQLIVRGFARVDAQRYNAIGLTERSRALLRGEERFTIREERKVERKSPGKHASRHSVAETDRALWEALRECRKELATLHGVPPYQIFHDASLMEMMERQPQSAAAMLAIHGVGQSKLDKFGAAFLEVIATHTRQK